MKQAAKVDANQPQIVADLRDIGATVKIVSQLKEFVDLVVGYRGVNYLLEVKDGNKPPSKRKLTPLEEKFQSVWQGQVATVKNIDEALEVIGATEARMPQGAPGATESNVDPKLDAKD